jgi:serine phosphatase RsbU (regulator of sigma subunit)
MPWPFVAAFLAIVEGNGRRLRYVSCGHEAALLFGADSRHVHLAANAPLLGVNDDADFRERSVSLKADDALVLATDGVTEARRTVADERFFGTAGLTAAYLALTRARRRTSEAMWLVHYAQNFSGGHLADDASALVAHFR